MNIYTVGIGPGDLRFMTPEAKHVIANCDVVVGYTPYLKLISDLLFEKTTIGTAMKGELARCRSAIEEARRGKTVAVVSSGDAGIYGMAALLLELLENETDIGLEIVPGITASTSAAAILGAPLSNDYAVISLSDLLTPRPVIEKRLDAAGRGDFVVCLYNPKSRSRTEHLRRACEILLRYKHPETPSGYVRNAFRGPSSSTICRLADLPDEYIDMLTTVIIGNSTTRIVGNRLVTSRGYRFDASSTEAPT